MEHWSLLWKSSILPLGCPHWGDSPQSLPKKHKHSLGITYSCLTLVDTGTLGHSFGTCKMAQKSVLLDEFKVENLYRMKKDTSEANIIIRKENGTRQPLSTTHIKAGESLDEAAKTAAFKVVEAEHKSIAAAEAVKEAERISKLAEETDSILQLAKEIFERCSRSEIVQVA